MLRSVLYIIFFIPTSLIASYKDSIAEKFVGSISVSELKTHISKLASDEFEGRGTGEIGQYLSADYIRNHFMNLGLKGSVNDTGYFQHYSINKMDIPELKLTINNTTYLNQNDYFLFNQNRYILPNFYSTNKFYSISNVYELTKKHKEYSVLYTYKTADKEELINKYIDLIEACNKYKVSLLFISKPEINLLDLIYDLSSALFKRGIMSKSAVIFISDNIMFDKKSELNFVINPISKLVQTQNVLGFIKGKTDETIVISSHYGHLGKKDGKIYYGTDNNASRTSTVLILSTTFANAVKSGIIPNRNILFITFSGEEIGLLGSKNYTYNNPIIPLKSISVNINNDIIGSSDYIYKNKEKYIYVIGSDKLSSVLHNTNESVNSTYQNLILDYKYNSEKDLNSFYYRSDHYDFAKHNIPVIFFFNGIHDDYQKHSDTVDKIELDLMEYRIKDFYYLVWKLANMNESISVDVLNSK